MKSLLLLLKKYFDYGIAVLESPQVGLLSLEALPFEVCRGIWFFYFNLSLFYLLNICFALWQESWAL